jgi:hypothetical protein
MVVVLLFEVEWVEEWVLDSGFGLVLMGYGYKPQVSTSIYAVQSLPPA